MQRRKSTAPEFCENSRKKSDVNHLVLNFLRPFLSPVHAPFGRLDHVTKCTSFKWGKTGYLLAVVVVVLAVVLSVQIEVMYK